MIVKTIKEVLENQEFVSNQIYDLLMDGKEAKVLEIISELGYQIRTENQAPLDEKAEFDNEVHELAIFLNGIIEKVEKNVDISDFEATQVVKSAKKAVKEITKDVMKTADVRRNLSRFDAEKYKKSMQKGIEEANKELERTQNDHDIMTRIDEEIFGNPPLNIDIINKDNQISALDEISKKLDEIKKLEENMAKLDPNNPDDKANIQNHKNKIDELMSGQNGIKAHLQALKDGGLYVTDLEDLIEHESNNSQKIQDNITTKKEKLNISLTKSYATIKSNLEIATKKYASFKMFSKIDFSKMHPSTKEGRKAIEDGYKPFKKVFIDIERRRANAQNNIDNFEQEIGTLDQERAILDRNTSDEENYQARMDEDTKAKIEAKKSEKHQDNRDKFYGNSEKSELYKEKFLKFKSHIVDKELSYIDRNGDRRIVQGKSVEDYEGMENDLDFLQLETYKERIERVSMYRATRDLYAYSPELARKLESAQTDAEKQAISKEIQRQFKLDSDYVKTFHGAHNTTKLQYESYMNAGSALKSMVPLKSADTFGGKLKIAAQNVGRYTGLKIPKFSRENEAGEKVSDVKSGLVTLGGDAIIVGATVAAPAAMGIAYLAKTGVVLGMRAYGRYYGKKHANEMEIPTPYDGKAGARRAAREAKYREDGHSTIGAWAISILDNVRPRHREDTENEIIEARNKEIDRSIDNQYISGAMASDEREKAKAIHNQQTRENIHERIRRSGEVYNDMYRETDMAKKRTVDLRIDEAVALGLGGEDISDSDRISFTDSKYPRSTNFAKAKLSISGNVKRAINSDTIYGERIGETVWTHSIENEQIARSITKTTDNKRRILTALAGLGLKGLGKLVKDQVVKDVEVEQGTGEYEQVQVGSHKDRDVIGYNNTQTTREAQLNDIKVSDLRREGDASWGAFNNGANYSTGYHPDVSFSSNDNTIQGLAFRFKDPESGQTMTYSISSKDIGDIVHNNPNLDEFTQVYANGELAINPNTSLEELKSFITDSNIRKAYENYLSQYSSSDQIDRMLDTMEFAWGRSQSVIGKGWAPNSLDTALRKVTDEVIDYSSPIYGPWKDIPDYELREIMKTVIQKDTITDPTLHALKDALDKAGLATALQQLGEAVGEISKPTKEMTSSGKPFVKLDKAEDVAHIKRPYVYRPTQDDDLEH